MRRGRWIIIIWVVVIFAAIGSNIPSDNQPIQECPIH